MSHLIPPIPLKNNSREKFHNYSLRQKRLNFLKELVSLSSLHEDWPFSSTQNVKRDQNKYLKMRYFKIPHFLLISEYDAD